MMLISQFSLRALFKIDSYIRNGCAFANLMNKQGTNIQFIYLRKVDYHIGKDNQLIVNAPS